MQCANKATSAPPYMRAQEMPNCSPDWELRSTDFVFSGNRQIRMFHARYKRDRSVQYTTYYDIDRQQWMNWQR
jgi:hypothetical protein